jgi:hypothetical protein
MLLSDISICTNALIKIGANSISSFEDGTAEAEVSFNLYPIVKNGLLSAYPWSFATCTKDLARCSEEPIADYKYSYQLPSDFLRVISAGMGNSSRGIEYKIVGNKLYTNHSSVVLKYIYSPREEDLPPYFIESLIAKLASEFCIPITESTSRAEMLKKLSDELFQKARVLDSQQDTPDKFEDFSLVEIRL